MTTATMTAISRLYRSTFVPTRLGKVFVKGHGKDFIVNSRNTATTAADSATHSRTSL